MDASCCVDRKIFFSPVKASSSARTLASRPTMNGVICCGKMTMSRTGIMGTRFISCFSRLNMQAPELLSHGKARLSGFLEQTPIDFVSPDHVGRHHEIAHLTLHRQGGHKLHNKVSH